MGGISWKREVLLDTLQELAGFKAGLVLSDDQIRERLPDHEDLLVGEPTEWVRTPAEEFDSIVQTLLFSLGAASTSEPASVFDLYAKYWPDEAKLAVYRTLSDIVFRTVTTAAVAGIPADLGSLISDAKRRFGDLGEAIAREILELAERAAKESPWNQMRYVDWSDKVELRSLFEDAALATAHGQFFDQRFIDYLAQNFSSIDNVHWRKFEGLAAEYFRREGAHVQVGPGSNDDGVDIRIWWPPDDASKPAAILVQCKREKSKIGRTVLKALYADVCHEQAASGLIVTTRDLSPGAKSTKIARAYPIEVANRETLRAWITQMRSQHVPLIRLDKP